jgi:hypothetical protein
LTSSLLVCSLANERCHCQTACSEMAIEQETSTSSASVASFTS